MCLNASNIVVYKYSLNHRTIVMFDKKCKCSNFLWPLVTAAVPLVHVEEVVEGPVSVAVSSDGHLDQRLLGH